MSDPHDDARDPIRRALLELPRERASESFDRRLRERLATSRDPARLRPRLAVAALLLAAAGITAWTAVRAGRERRAAEHRAALEQRHEQLRHDLDDLREKALRTPTLYVGSASDLDLVLDLEPWMEPSPTIQPAAYGGPNH